MGYRSFYAGSVFSRRVAISPAASLTARPFRELKASISIWFALQYPTDLSTVLKLHLASVDGSHIAQLEVNITVSRTTPGIAAQTGVEEATSAYEQMNSVPTTAIDRIQSNTQTFQTIVSPVINDVMGVPKLRSILKNLEGFMEIADFVADVCIRRLVPGM